MQVFLIPIAADRYEPYFEPVDGEDAPDDGGTGWFARQRRRFSEMLREAEAERNRRHETPVEAPAGLATRWRRTFFRWIVERAAEQRLLWHLRTATAATLQVPDDLASDPALAILHQGFKRDGERHRRWFFVNFVVLVASIALAIIPGPNMLGYFFTFTTVGHFLAWRGATQGQRGVTWQVQPTPLLTTVRAIVVANAHDRDAQLQATSEALGLRHLATFVARLAVPPA